MAIFYDYSDAGPYIKVPYLGNIYFGKPAADRAIKHIIS